MNRVYNFSAGPAVLPEEVLREAADEMLDYRGTGMSVMEMSHRSKAFEQIITEAEQDIRDLMGIPDNYKVLFLQGGASQQFAMIPMNLMKNRVADYIITGQWAKKAAKEAVCPSVPDAGRGKKPDAAGAAVYGGICCVAWGKGQRRCDTPGEQDQTTQEKSCP